MHAAPRAVIDDGLFDVVGMENMTKRDTLFGTAALYDGKLLEHRKVTFARAKRVHAEPVRRGDHVLLDVDGEAPGRLPATFEMRACAFQLRA
jgi:diacylglycerol kinase family enzyme